MFLTSQQIGEVGHCMLITQTKLQYYVLPKSQNQFYQKIPLGRSLNTNQITVSYCYSGRPQGLPSNRQLPPIYETDTVQKQKNTTSTKPKLKQNLNLGTSTSHRISTREYNRVDLNTQTLLIQNI